VGLSLALFLLLTTNFGTQYLAWAAAAVLLLDLWAGLAYNLSAGVLLVVTYTYWTHGFPWNQAFSKPFTPSQERLGWLTWTVLLAAVALGIRRLWRWPEAAEGNSGAGESHRAQVDQIARSESLGAGARG
jgi:hypothetical protein